MHRDLVQVEQCYQTRVVNYYLDAGYVLVNTIQTTKPAIIRENGEMYVAYRVCYIVGRYAGVEWVPFPAPHDPRTNNREDRHP